jgi:hypothetical protein
VTVTPPLAAAAAASKVDWLAVMLSGAASAVGCVARGDAGAAVGLAMDGTSAGAAAAGGSASMVDRIRLSNMPKGRRRVRRFLWLDMVSLLRLDGAMGMGWRSKGSRRLAIRGDLDTLLDILE